MHDPTGALTPPVTTRTVVEVRPGAPGRVRDDELAVEEPLELRVRGRSVCVTMRTPGHDVELAAGFLLTEGVVARAADVLRIEPCPGDDEDNVLNVVLAPEVRVDFDRLTRHVFTSSSCGLCGRATIDGVHRRFPPVPPAGTIAATTVADLPRRLLQGQAAFGRTGGLHAAALFDLDGATLAVREDIGRHNAVDKVVGRALLDGLLPLQHHLLLVSGRASFEIVQKALAARVPIVAAVSAPSSLAADLARRSGMTLVGFLRDGRMNVYSGAQRVVSG